MQGAELRRETIDRGGIALNTVLGVGGEAVNAAVEILLLPSLVLAFFVAELTPSYPMIGLVPALASSLWTIGRLPGHLLAGTGRQQPWAFAAAIVRSVAIAILAVVASRADPAGLATAGRPLLGTLFLCLIVYAFAGGFGSVPGAALLRGAIGAESWESFVRWRSAWSMGLCLVAALIVSRILGSPRLAFPSNYGRLFLVATVCLIAVTVFAGAFRESPARGSGPSAPAFSPRAVRQPLHDPRYRRFLLFRILLTATAGIDPFLFLYAVTRLGAATTAIGGYAVAGVLGWLITAPLWVWGERRWGARAILQGAAVARLVAPALALVLPELAATGPMRERMPDPAVATTVFGIAFFTIGAALAAQARGNHDYLASLAPQQLLPAYSALSNGVLVPVAFAPVLGGLLIHRAGYEALFGAALALGLAAVFAGGWLVDMPARRRDRADFAGGPRRPLALRA